MGLPLVAAVVVVVGVAEYMRRQAGDIEGYYVAKRRASLLLVTGTYVASWASVSGMVGMTSSAYRLGVAFNQLTWGFWGNFLSAFAICLPLRKLAARMGELQVGEDLAVESRALLTPTDFLGLRFPTKSTRAIMGAMVVVGLLFYATGQLIGMTLAFQMLGLTYEAGLLITLLILAWTSMRGGTPGVIVNDTISMFTFVIAALVFFPFAVKAVGGVRNLVQMGEQIKPGIWSPSGYGTTIAYLLSYNLVWNCMTGGSPHLIQRVYAADDERTFAKAIVIGVPVVIIWTWFLYTAVQAGIILFPNLKGLEIDRIFPLVAAETMPPVLAGLCLAGIFAVGLSTVNTQLTNIAFSLGRDFYQSLFSPKASESQILSVTKSMIWIVTIILGILTWIRPGFIYELTSWGVGFYGCVFVPVFIMAFYWSRVTTQGALAGSVIAVLVYIVLTAMKVLKFPPLLITLPLAVVLIAVISLCTKQSPREKEIVDKMRVILREYKPSAPATFSDYLLPIGVIAGSVVFGIVFGIYF